MIETSNIINKIFIKNLDTIDYAVFDFDGTLYPNLFIFDITKKIFMETNKNKLTELSLIAQEYKNGNFSTAYKKFISLLSNESEIKFINESIQIVNNSYKYAKLSIQKLKNNYNIEPYLISITADFIAEVVKNYFGFNEAFAIKYNIINNTRMFNGKTLDIIDSPQNMKKRMLNKLINLKNNNNFISFYDSLDDKPITESAKLKVAINPNKETIKKSDPDVILVDKLDPWKLFYEAL